MNKSILLLKDLLEPSKKFTNIWLQYQKKAYIANIVNKHNSTYHSTIKLRPADVKSNTYIEHLKFEVGEPVRISKYKNIFAKGYTPNWSEEVFLIKKAKNTALRAYVISDLNGGKTVGMFYEKELKKRNNSVKKLIKRKSDKLHVKWKRYDICFNRRIDKKDIV